jgi:hypothetical protein
LSKKKETVEIKKFELETQPMEGEWYEVQAWRKDDSPYAFMFENKAAWRSYGYGSALLSRVVPVYQEARETYTKVRIVRTVKSVVDIDYI